MQLLIGKFRENRGGFSDNFELDRELDKNLPHPRHLTLQNAALAGPPPRKIASTVPVALSRAGQQLVDSLSRKRISSQKPMKKSPWLPLCCIAWLSAIPNASAQLPSEALAAAKKATSFLTTEVSTEGGYLWRYSADLTKREGEGIVKTQTVWVQPPGTPSVGQAFVRLFEATGDQQFLTAAKAAGEALRLGQMRSGGWQASVEFDPERRRKWAYRTDPKSRKAKDQSSLDDDKTQSAIRFVMQLDRALEFKDKPVHEMAMFALGGLLTKGQFDNGGFPQVWIDEKQPDASAPAKRASYPDSWPREYPGHRQYWNRYTLNDNLASDVIDTLFLAEAIYHEPRFRQSAVKLADSLLLAQMPDPQPAWAQQYSADMQPIWARKFEPAAITGGESQSVIRTLLEVYRYTGDDKYLKPIPTALAYLKRSEISQGQLARFYELKTNRPLYFNRQYELTYDDSDMPTHYGFKIASKVDSLRSQYNKLVATQWTKPPSLLSSSRKPSDKEVRRIIDTQDSRGAWLTPSGMRYHKTNEPAIEMARTVKHLETLAAYLKSASH